MQHQYSAYQELAESISDVFFAMDKNLKYTYWNKASEVLTGIPAANALGKSLMDLLPDNPERQRVKEVCVRVMKTKQSEQFTVNYPGDDRIIHEISVYPSSDGVSVFVKDVTARTLAEQALRESEARYNSLATTVDSAVVLDKNCRHIYANEHYIRYTGQAADAVIGHQYRQFHGEEASRVFADAVKYVFETGQPYQDEWMGRLSILIAEPWRHSGMNLLISLIWSTGGDWRILTKHTALKSLISGWDTWKRQ